MKKTLMIGILIGGLLSFSLQTLASSVLKTWTAKDGSKVYQTNHSLVVNDQKANLGMYVMLNYEGRTYVSLPLVTQLLKQPIAWDKETTTISVGGTEYKRASKIMTQKTNGCTLYSLISAIEIDYYKKTKRVLVINEDKLYNDCLKYGYSIKNGSSLTEMFYYLKQLGYITNNRYYDTTPTKQEIINQLDNGKAVIAALDSADGFNNPKNGYVKYNPTSVYAGHAVCIVGYNKNGYIIKNSYGTSYGKQGYATVDFNYPFSAIETIESIIK